MHIADIRNKTGKITANSNNKYSNAVFKKTLINTT